MATDTPLDDLMAEYPTPEGQRGYIAGQHPDDLAEQRALARRLLAYGQIALDQADNQARELEAEAALLASQARKLRQEAVDTNSRQWGHVQEWFADSTVREHFGRKLLLGRYTAAWGKRPRTYTVDERAVLRRAEVDPTLEEQGVVEYQVNKQAARDRFKMDAEGRIIDTTTGEVVEPDIEQGALLIVTDPGGMTVKISVAKGG